MILSNEMEKSQVSPVFPISSLRMQMMFCWVQLSLTFCRKTSKLCLIHWPVFGKWEVPCREQSPGTILRENWATTGIRYCVRPQKHFYFLNVQVLGIMYIMYIIFPSGIPIYPAPYTHPSNGRKKKYLHLRSFEHIGVFIFKATSNDLKNVRGSRGEHC